MKRNKVIALLTYWLVITLVFILAPIFGQTTVQHVSAESCSGAWDATVFGLKLSYQPGENIDVVVSFKARNPADCSGCIQQILVGMVDQNGTAVDVYCVYDGQAMVCPNWTTGNKAISLKAPSVTGTYKIVAANEYQYNCQDAQKVFFGQPTGPLKEIASINIEAKPMAPTSPPPEPELGPLPNPFEDTVPKIQNLIAQIKQTIDLIIQQIWHVIKTIVLPLAILAVVGIFLWKFRRGIKEPPPGKPPYIPKWTFEAPAMETPQEFDIWNEIRNFRQRKGCSQEKEYQEELYRHLKRKFPQAEEQVKIGEAIIDIRIDKTAIEIKGPTRATDFNRLRGQIQHYTFYYNLVYVVLFDPKFGHTQFDSLKTGIQRDWPNDVGVITKPG